MHKDKLSEIRENSHLPTLFYKGKIRKKSSGLVCLSVVFCNWLQEHHFFFSNSIQYKNLIIALAKHVTAFADTLIFNSTFHEEINILDINFYTKNNILTLTSHYNYFQQFYQKLASNTEVFLVNVLFSTVFEVDV